MTSENRSNSGYTHIKEIIDAILPQCRRESDTEIARIRKTWNRVVPPEMAEHAQPAAIKNDILLVHVSSSTLTHQLRFMVEELKEQLNAASESYPINQIKFKIGKV
ncbi:MAG: DUF721 domain-containing protein [Desulfobacterales bacterium]|nr:DUF721 domain-containing protein [Desulfobacterales bacterium]